VHLVQGFDDREEVREVRAIAGVGGVVHLDLLFGFVPDAACGRDTVGAAG
jgi:hypothetical protein